MEESFLSPRPPHLRPFSAQSLCPRLWRPPPPPASTNSLQVASTFLSPPTGDSPMPDESVMRVLMTQRVPEAAIARLREAAGSSGVLDINPDPDLIWTHDELIEHLRGGDYNALYCLLTNKIDAEVLDAAPNVRIVANMAVG